MALRAAFSRDLAISARRLGCRQTNPVPLDHTATWLVPYPALLANLAINVLADLVLNQSPAHLENSLPAATWPAARYVQRVPSTAFRAQVDVARAVLAPLMLVLFFSSPPLLLNSIHRDTLETQIVKGNLKCAMYKTECQGTDFHLTVAQFMHRILPREPLAKEHALPGRGLISPPGLVP